MWAIKNNKKPSQQSDNIPFILRRAFLEAFASESFDRLKRETAGRNVSADPYSVYYKNYQNIGAFLYPAPASDGVFSGIKRWFSEWSHFLVSPMISIFGIQDTFFAVGKLLKDLANFVKEPKISHAKAVVVDAGKLIFATIKMCLSPVLIALKLIKFIFRAAYLAVKKYIFTQEPQSTVVMLNAFAGVNKENHYHFTAASRTDSYEETPSYRVHGSMMTAEEVLHRINHNTLGGPQSAKKNTRQIFTDCQDIGMATPVELSYVFERLPILNHIERKKFISRKLDDIGKHHVSQWVLLQGLDGHHLRMRIIGFITRDPQGVNYFMEWAEQLKAENEKQRYQADEFNRADDSSVSQSECESQGDIENSPSDDEDESVEFLSEKEVESINKLIRKNGRYADGREECDRDDDSDHDDSVNSRSQGIK